MTQKYQALVEHLSDINNLEQISSVLGWDQQVNMPAGGTHARGRHLATLARLQHELFTDEKTGHLLDDAAAELNGADYESDEASLIRIVRDDYERANRLPSAFVAKMAQVTTEAHEIWARARATNDFRLFQPMLEQIMDLKRQEADYRGYGDHPYDALLDQYERGMTTAKVKEIFDGHKPQLVELIAAIGKNESRVSDAVLHQPFPIDKQRDFSLWVINNFGFDFNRGRQDIAVHPFAISFSRDDVRITTRFNENFLNPALFGMLHEAGHGMYEQGVGEALEGTPLASGASLGVHESQSRMWENIVGRSKGFWQWALPELQKTFPDQLRGVDLDTFYKAINKVKRQFIRVEADEATYNLHIMLRFEMETEIITGSLKVADLAEEWNDRFEAYFGITPPTDTLGVLQDVHWSSGLFGYFPTYALGNLLSVQYYNRALQDHPQIPDEISRGKFDTLLRWLNTNIHQHGRKFTAPELTERVTGSAIDSQPYVNYLQDKYRDIYGL